MADADTLTFTLSTGGDVVIKLRPDLAPGHVERITGLARDGFYDGVVFHRVIPGFMAQGGDPTGTGTGGSELPDLQAEFSDRAARPRHLLDGAHQLSPQRQQPVLHLLRRRRFLDNQYTVWGQGRERHGICRCAAGRRAAARAGQDRQGDGRLSDGAGRADHRRLGRPGGRFRPAAQRQGQRLVLAARRKDRLDALAAELGNARAVEIDLCEAWARLTGWWPTSPRMASMSTC